MTLVILCFCIILIVFCIVAYSHIKQENSDTSSKENIIELWVNSLNARKFNRDNKTLKEFDDKLKKSIKRNVLKVKKLFKEIEVYLKG